jgi:serine/threonine protein kinase
MLALVTQFCEGSTLYDNLHTKTPENGGIDLNDTHRQTSVSKAIANGMYFLHNRNIIHRDLKSPNIFLDGTTPKIGDFGLATMKNKWSKTKTITGQQAGGNLMGSLLWMDGTRNYDTKICRYF